MIRYADGSEVQAGDAVLLHDGLYTGTVHRVIDSPVAMAEWGLHVPGLMINTSYGGLVFREMATLTGDELQLVSRAKL